MGGGGWKVRSIYKESPVEPGIERATRVYC